MLATVSGLKTLLEEVFKMLETAVNEPPERLSKHLAAVLSIKNNVLDTASRLEREAFGLLKELDSSHAKLTKLPKPGEPVGDDGVAKPRAQQGSESGESTIVRWQQETLKRLTERNLYLLGALDADNYKGNTNGEIGGASYVQHAWTTRSDTNQLLLRLLEKSEALSAKLINRKIS